MTIDHPSNPAPPTCWSSLDNLPCACCDDNIPRIEELGAEIRRLREGIRWALDPLTRPGTVRGAIAAQAVVDLTNLLDREDIQ